MPSGVQVAQALAAAVRALAGAYGDVARNAGAAARRSGLPPDRQLAAQIRRGQYPETTKALKERGSP